MEWPFVAVRIVHFAATIALFGVFTFQCLVLRPAARGVGPWRSPRLDRDLIWLAWTSLALTLASGAAWLLVVAARMSGQPFAAALSGGAWKIVLLRTDFGEDWLVRLGLAGVVAIALAARRAAAPAADWAGLSGAAPLLAALAWAGHGAATLGAAGELHTAADILHLLCAGLWLGMLLPLALLLAEMQRSADPAWRRGAGAAARRFSALAIGSVVLLPASGIVNAWFLVGSIPALVGTAYGRLLLVKIVLFFAMLVVAALNRLRLMPRLSRDAGAAAWLRRNTFAEVGLGLGVLALVGLLGILPPGVHARRGATLASAGDAAATGYAAHVRLMAAGSANRYNRRRRSGGGL